MNSACAMVGCMDISIERVCQRNIVWDAEDPNPGVYYQKSAAQCSLPKSQNISNVEPLATEQKCEFSQLSSVKCDILFIKRPKRKKEHDFVTDFAFYCPFNWTAAELRMRQVWHKNSPIQFWEYFCYGIILDYIFNDQSAGRRGKRPASHA